MQSAGVWGAKAALPGVVQRFLDESTSADVCRGQTLSTRSLKSTLIPDSLSVLNHLASAAAFRTKYKTLLPFGLVVPLLAHQTPKAAALVTCLWQLLPSEQELGAVNEGPHSTLPLVSDKVEAVHTTLVQLGPLSLTTRNRQKKQKEIQQLLNLAPRQTADGSAYTWAHFKVRFHCMLLAQDAGHVPGLVCLYHEMMIFHKFACTWLRIYFTWQEPCKLCI